MVGVVHLEQTTILLDGSHVQILDVVVFQQTTIGRMRGVGIGKHHPHLFWCTQVVSFMITSVGPAQRILANIDGALLIVSMWNKEEH